MTIPPEHRLYKNGMPVSSGPGDQATTLFIVFVVMLVMTWVSV